MGEVAIPKSVAAQLTIPITVNNYNIQEMYKLISDGKANFYTKKNTYNRINLKYALNPKGTPVYEGDIVLRNGSEINITRETESSFVLKEGDQIFRDNEKVENVKYPTRKSITIENGDIIERQLQGGDFILLNRQPSLHIGSIIAHKVVIRPYNTFRFSLAVARSFNADFD